MIDPRNVYERWTKDGLAWAEAVGTFEQLDAVLKPLKAKLALEAKSLEACSMAEAEQHAYASEAYQNAAQAAASAKQAMLSAKVRYDATQAEWEARRTLEASERAANRSAT